MTTQLKDVVEALPDEVKEGVKIAAVKTSAGLTLWGFTLESWVAIATITYFALQIYVVAVKNWDALWLPWQKLKAWWAARRAP